jgi:hypothetical protein
MNRVLKKNKYQIVALILAILFSFFSFLYTYKFDKTKFWMGLLLSIIGLFLYYIPNILVWIWAIAEQLSKDEDMFKNYSEWTVK